MEIKTFALGPLQTNCYVLAGETEAVAVDPGGDPAPVLAYLKENNLTLTHILNTHLHFDHTYGNSALSAATGAPILHGEDDAYLLDGELGRGGLFGLPQVEPYEAHTIKPGQTAFAGFDCTVLATPGHSKGSLTFYFPDADYGSPRMTDWLKTQGHQVNHKRVERLMQLMGLQAITPGPHTSVPNPEHPVFPYLLKGVAIERKNQVWSADITYIPMQRGFLYLVAVIDWWSRFVLAWELSNSMDSSFCVEALNKALRISTPEVFNTDQGAQFTSREFTGVLQSKGIAISMDGKGRAIDNVFIERLWWTVKYEDIYPRAYCDGIELYHGLTRYFRYYNEERGHSSLDKRTPAAVYRSNLNVH
jgi:putative transposase